MTSQQENKKEKVCIPKSTTHQQKEIKMKMNLPPSAAEWMMSQPAIRAPAGVESHTNPHHVHHLPTLATQ
jgi:hypothetical protein